MSKRPTTSSTPNRITIQAMEDTEAGRNLTVHASVDDYFLAMEPWWRRLLRWARVGRKEESDADPS